MISRKVINEIYDDAFTGLINSANKDYFTSSGYKATTVRVYLNGIRQKNTTDYVEILPNKITMTDAPITGDILIIDYEKA